MIYADNAATTRIADSVLERMLPFLREQYGNPASQYTLGVESRKAIEYARQQVAAAINASPSEIVFTSGGSEGNTWLLRSFSSTCSHEKAHIVTSSIEHHSIINTCHFLEEQGVEITYLPVDSNGRISVSNVVSALRPNTKLVSIMLANNEIGTIQPIAEIGEILKKEEILFHTDAVQAVGHIPINVGSLNVDMLTASAHKFNGAKGIGFIFARDGIRLPPYVFGGEQEKGKRAGTENVAAIVGLGYALEESSMHLDTESERQSSLVSETIEELKDLIPDIQINAEHAIRLPGILNITFASATGESIMHLLDLKSICVSTSSACSAGRGKASHVLLALGLSEKQAKSSIRISYGKYNTKDEAREIAASIAAVYGKTRKHQNSGDGL